MATHIHIHKPVEHLPHTDDLVIHDERQVEAIAHESPEGRPTREPLSSRGIKTLLIGLFASAIAVGLLIALFVHIVAGVAIAIVGALLLLANPVVWAAAHRAEERRKIEQHEEPTDPMAPPPLPSTRGVR